MSEQTEETIQQFFERSRVRLTPGEHRAHQDRVAQWAATAMMESGAPERHRRVEELKGGKWAEKLAEFRGRLGTGLMVALIGGRGTGKTQMAVELMRHTAHVRCKKPRFTTAAKFIISLKASFQKDSEKSEGAVFAEFTRPALLVIDEFGRRTESDWENNAIFELLNDRYNAMVDTVLISNHEIEAFKVAAGPSLLSRLSECGGVCECNWESFREGK